MTGLILTIFGVLIAFLGCIVDGVFANNIQETDFAKCSYSGGSNIAKTCFPSKSKCWSFSSAYKNLCRLMPEVFRVCVFVFFLFFFSLSFISFIMFIFFSDAYCVGLSVPKWSCYCCYVYAERQCRVHPFTAGSRIADQKAMLPFLYQDVESCGEVEYQFGYGG